MTATKLPPVHPGEVLLERSPTDGDVRWTPALGISVGAVHGAGDG